MLPVVNLLLQYASSIILYNRKCLFVIINNVHSQLLTRNQYNVVHEFTCNFAKCKSLQNSYIGMTARTVAERLHEQRYKGSIYKHLMAVNGYRITLDEILKLSNILYRVQTRKYIHVFEA